MSFQKFKSISDCVGGRHRHATRNTYGDITSEGHKVIFGCCSICSRIKSMTVNDNTIAAKGFGDLFKPLFKKGLNVSKKMEKKC